MHRVANLPRVIPKEESPSVHFIGRLRGNDAPPVVINTRGLRCRLRMGATDGRTHALARELAKHVGEFLLWLDVGNVPASAVRAETEAGVKNVGQRVAGVGGWLGGGGGKPEGAAGSAGRINGIVHEEKND
eukprot:CAMPEP_0184727824 /NCGR_PEP_ID=MMETSP0314-20130426/37485_1 /TAXON_ID=38298 /ORGANISM="Rhodella maculata, Strain CCMP 736" /LENGTH=130 /DNA_ID=CAMNT_0027193505 /DNA_START=1206 /DNA_END=1595 /DNA_ORIENTATION=+